MSNWQPIETAPKDETAVDLWVVEVYVRHTERNTGRRVVDAKWGTGWKYMYDSKDTFDGWASFESMYTHAVEAEICGGARFATHWMPLPQPPNAKQ